MTKHKFLLSKSLNSEDFSHLICINPIAIYTLPLFELISGESDIELRDKAISWHKDNKDNEIKVARLIPVGYEDAIQKLKSNIELIDIALLSKNVGVRELDINRVLDGFQYKGKSFHFSYRTRVKFMDEVEKLLL